MPRYTLNLAGRGDFIYSDDGDRWVAAETAGEAKTYFLLNDGEWPRFVHSWIGRARCVTKRDVEAGDCHEDAEPGDTTYEFIRDDGRELRSNEVRLWERGPWSPHWSMEPPWYHGGAHDGPWLVKVGPFEFKAATRDEACEIRDRERATATEAWKTEHPDETLNERIVCLLRYGYYLSAQTAAEIVVELHELIEDEFGCELPTQRPTEVAA